MNIVKFASKRFISQRFSSDVQWQIRHSRTAFTITQHSLLVLVVNSIAWSESGLGQSY